MLLSEAVALFLISLKRNPKSRHTLKNYSFYLTKFTEFVGVKDIANLSVVDINNYKNYLDGFNDPRTKQPLKNSTKNYYLIALRSLLSFLNLRNEITLPSSEVVLQKQTPRKIEILNEEQIGLILRSPGKNNKEQLRNTLILQLIFYTSLKAQDIVRLNRDSIDPDLLTIALPDAIKKIIINSEIASIFQLYLMARKDVFTPLFIRFQGVEDVTQNGEKMRLTERSIERIVEKYGKKCGIEGLTPQKIRIASIEALLKKGEDIPAVADRLGHKNTDSTLVYIRKIV